MDGDSSAKAMDQGANSALMSSDEHTGMPESTKAKSEPMGEKTTGAGTSVFDKTGAIGKQFTSEGALGGTAQKVGGPFDKEGMVGKQFTASGSIGGTVQQNLASGESTSFDQSK